MKKKNTSSKDRPAPTPGKSPEAGAGRDDLFPIVGVGASAGGLEAFTQLLKNLPAKTGMTYVLVQHLDPTHKSILPELLSRSTNMPVREVKDRVVVEPNNVYVIPPNTNMAVMHGVLHLLTRTLTRGQHLPIDYFFRSLAEDRGVKAIGVILSGTASDGAMGLEAIKAAGGITFAQDEKSAKFTGMPQHAIAAGCVDFVLSPEEIGAELSRIGRHPYLTQPEEAQTPAFLARSGDELNKIYLLLRSATGVDFTHYKQTTLQRRIKRRMVLHKIDRLKEYLDYLHGNPREVKDLYQDFLIHVTGFFREPAAFNALKVKVFPKLVEKRSPESPIRIWVPGCSSGEEVYSLVIALLEFLSLKTGNPPLNVLGTVPIQVFGTDIASQRISIARAGMYPESITPDVSPERLKNFFIKLEHGYQICKPIREACLFAEQNAVKDPPFSRLDLISCRNLLIYLGPVLQKRLLPIFHFALKPNGFLMLGSSESVGGFSDQFLLVEKKHKIYLRKRAVTRMMPQLEAREEIPAERVQRDKGGAGDAGGFALDREADRLLLSKYVPPSIVISDNQEILQFRGQVGSYLEPSAGEAAFTLSKMARQDLLTDMRIAFARAKKENAPVLRERAGASRDVDVEVIPIKGRVPQEKYFLILFHPHSSSTQPRVAKATPAKGGRPQEKPAREVRELDQLEEELNQTREHLQAIIEEQETTNEELRSANEEVLSNNEELQSTNEELETAKEELQSSNEELTTLNEELQNRNLELSVAINDLNNLLSNVNIPIVMLTGDLRIRHFTPPSQKMLNLLPGDLHRRIGELRPNVQVEDLEHIISDAIDSVVPVEQEIQDQQGRWHMMRVRPYKTTENKIDGAVVSFMDIDMLKRSLERSRDFAETIVETAREPLLVLDEKLRVQTANPSFYQAFHLSPEEIENQFIYDVAGGHLSNVRLRALLEEIVPKNARVDAFEVEAEFPNLGRKTMLFNARRINIDSGRHLILVAIEDITERKRSEQELRRLSGRLLQLQDEERRRIARELHDTTGQKLAALVIDLARVGKEAGDLSEHARGTLTEGMSLAEQVSGEIRTLSYLLHPPLLEEAGLAPAIRWYVDGFAKRSNLSASVEIDPNLGRFPEDVEMAFFRVVQEALGNIHLHSGSKEAGVRLYREDERITLEVEDFGRGMAVGNPVTTVQVGVGLQSMRERMKQIGGRLEVVSGPQGTIVRASLSLGDES